MKKVIFGIIAIQSFFATGLVSAECYMNYPYNGQLVTYCVWNWNTWGGYYNYNNGTYYNPYYNWNSNNYNGTYYNPWYNYQGSNCSSQWYRSDEENYYIMLYNNWFEWPGDNKNEDYFDVKVLWKDVELDRIDEVNLKEVSFSSSSYKTKYESSLNFINQLKEEMKIRYLLDKMSRNKVYDATAALENLVYSLNEQYTNLKRFEDTKKKFYKELAKWNSKDVSSRYKKLKTILKDNY